jgi:hypothetical protein
LNEQEGRQTVMMMQKDKLKKNKIQGQMAGKNRRGKAESIAAVAVED